MADEPADPREQNAAQASNASAGVTTKVSPRPVAETVSRLTAAATAHGLKVFAVIDQSAAAREVGLELRETTLVIFGSPEAGTPVMVAAPLTAVDLPESTRSPTPSSRDSRRERQPAESGRRPLRASQPDARAARASHPREPHEGASDRGRGALRPPEACLPPGAVLRSAG
jgi:hypothetical protein